MEIATIIKVLTIKINAFHSQWGEGFQHNMSQKFGDMIFHKNDTIKKLQLVYRLSYYSYSTCLNPTVV